jgi:hypothetical protein
MRRRRDRGVEPEAEAQEIDGYHVRALVESAAHGGGDQCPQKWNRRLPPAAGDGPYRDDSRRLTASGRRANGWQGGRLAQVYI